MIKGTKSLTRISIVLVTTVLMAACSASVESTVTQVEPTGVQTEPTRAQPEPTGVQTEPTTVDPTTVPAEAAAENADTADAAEPTALPSPRELPVSDFRTDTLLGLSLRGDFAYAATSSSWNAPSECDGPPTESIAVVAVDVAVTGDWTPVAAGLEQAGDVRNMIFNEAGLVAIESSCGEFAPRRTVWVHSAVISADGRLSEFVGPIQLQAATNETDVWVSRWVDGDTLEVHVTIEVDPDDFDSWIVERRHISLSTGATTTVEQVGYYDEGAFSSPIAVTTDQGFTYREIADPGLALGCEGYGIGRTIEVDDGTERRLALAEDGPVFASVNNLHVSAIGHILWTTGCEGFTSAYVGKVRSDGSITDAHLIESEPVGEGGFNDFQYYQLRDDGVLVAMGRTFDQASEVDRPVVARFDLSTDPGFVNTADPSPAIDPAPILVAIDGVSGWHVGETLSSQPACGGTTLYGRTQSGFVRAFGQFTEIDAIVDADVAEIVRVSFPDSDYVGRTVVFSTECPGEYEGRRVWFGTENENLNWGLALEQADMAEVKDVLSVRDEFEDGRDFPVAGFVEVELLDGTISEIELIAVPFQ